jgi:hypothetical protein
MKTLLHLLNGAPDELVQKVIEAQRAAGFPVEVIRLDEVKDWGEVVDRVMQADSVSTW